MRNTLRNGSKENIRKRSSNMYFYLFKVSIAINKNRSVYANPITQSLKKRKKKKKSSIKSTYIQCHISFFISRKVYKRVFSIKVILFKMKLFYYHSHHLEQFFWRIKSSVILKFQIEKITTFLLKFANQKFYETNYVNPENVLGIFKFCDFSMIA